MAAQTSPHPDEEVATVLAGKTAEPQHPDRPCSTASTTMTNYSRGNVSVSPQVTGWQDSVHQLAGKGELVLLKQHLATTAMDSPDTSGFTPLMWAAANNQQETVEYLVTSGASVSQSGLRGETALSLAASRGHENIVRYLLRQPRCEVDAKDASGSTPLLYAVAGNHVTCVRILLENGADIAHRNESDLSAYDLALSHKHTEIQHELEKCMLDLLHEDNT